MRSNADSGALARYFDLLDARKVDDLVDMFADDGVMITKGGTNGQPISGHDELRAFYLSRGPATARHEISAQAQSRKTSMAEGLVRSIDGTSPVKFFIASASLDAAGLITRYTTLVWPDLSDDQAIALAGAAGQGN